METLPAARPVRICTNGNAVAAAPNFKAPRRDIERFVIRLFSGIFVSLYDARVIPPDYGSLAWQTVTGYRPPGHPEHYCQMKLC
jgi:hypothetical protein